MKPASPARPATGIALPNSKGLRLVRRPRSCPWALWRGQGRAPGWSRGGTSARGVASASPLLVPPSAWRGGTACRPRGAPRSWRLGLPAAFGLGGCPSSLAARLAGRVRTWWQAARPAGRALSFIAGGTASRPREAEFTSTEAATSTEAEFTSTSTEPQPRLAGLTSTEAESTSAVAESSAARLAGRVWTSWQAARLAGRGGSSSLAARLAGRVRNWWYQAARLAGRVRASLGRHGQRAPVAKRQRKAGRRPVCRPAARQPTRGAWN